MFAEGDAQLRALAMQGLCAMLRSVLSRVLFLFMLAFLAASCRARISSPRGESDKSAPLTAESITSEAITWSVIVPAGIARLGDGLFEALERDFKDETPYATVVQHPVESQDFPKSALYLTFGNADSCLEETTLYLSLADEYLESDEPDRGVLASLHPEELRPLNALRAHLKRSTESWSYDFADAFRDGSGTLSIDTVFAALANRVWSTEATPDMEATLADFRERLVTSTTGTQEQRRRDTSPYQVVPDLFALMDRLSTDEGDAADHTTISEALRAILCLYLEKAIANYRKNNSGAAVIAMIERGLLQRSLGRCDP